MTTLKFDEWQDVGGTPVMRINAGVLEVWDGSAWAGAGRGFTNVPYLLIGGGGAGGTGASYCAGGGGAGGFIGFDN